MNMNTTATISSARGGRPHRRPRERSSPWGAADGPPFQAAEEAQDDMGGSPHVNVNNIDMLPRLARFKERPGVGVREVRFRTREAPYPHGPLRGGSFGAPLSAPCTRARTPARRS